MPPAKKKVDDDDDLPPSDNDEEAGEALLGAGDDKQPASDAPAPAEPLLSPREKLRQKGKNTPLLTPRTVAAQAEAALEEAAKDPKAAAEKAAAQAEAALAEADPAAAEALKLAKAAASDPKVAAKLAADEAMRVGKAFAAADWNKTGAGLLEEQAKARAYLQALWDEAMNDRPPPLCPMEDLSQRWQNYINLLNEIPEGKLPPDVQAKLVPYVTLAIKVILALSGWVSFVCRWAYRIWRALPFNVTQIIFGAALCYFGGTFTMSIAAMEAFRTMGYQQAREDVLALAEQLRPVWEANDADDLVDDDGDGISDVDQITPPQLLQRKIMLIVTNLKEPQRIQSAFKSIYSALLAVLATLKLEFAQTTAMAMGIADMVKKPLVKFGEPPLKQVLPPQAHQWIVPTIDSVVRIIAISVAMYIMKLISCFYAALRGGKLIAEGIINILVDKAKIGIVICPGMVDETFDPTTSLIDDVIGWIIAMQGFMFQVNSGLRLTDPWTLLLFPLQMIEDALTLYVGASAVLDAQAQQTGAAPAGRMLSYLDAEYMCVPFEMANHTLPGYNVTVEHLLHQIPFAQS